MVKLNFAHAFALSVLIGPSGVGTSSAEPQRQNTQVAEAQLTPAQIAKRRAKQQQQQQKQGGNPGQQKSPGQVIQSQQPKPGQQQKPAQQANPNPNKAPNAAVPAGQPNAAQQKRNNRNAQRPAEPQQTAPVANPKPQNQPAPVQNQAQPAQLTPKQLRQQARQQRQQQKQQQQQTQKPNQPNIPPAAGAQPNNPPPAATQQKNPPPAASNAVVNMRPTAAVAKQTYVAPPKPRRSIAEISKQRKERVAPEGKFRYIEEPDKRIIVKQDNRVIIRNDDTERFRRIARNSNSVRRPDGTVETVIVRGDGVRVYNVSDANGRILQRYRRDRNGQDVIIIDNRQYYDEDRHDVRDRNRNLAIGVGAGLILGAAIVALAPPVYDIPREKYIVDYGHASDDDVYEALSAPPVERLERNYSLEEIRYSAPLRERMRRVDIDTVTFEFGSWEVRPEYFDTLARIADGINKVIDRNPQEVFLVEGYTDAVGSEEDNLTLSDRRAQSVAEILTSRFDVPPENLVTQGYGEQNLKVNTDGPEQANRRIAVRRISPLMSEQFRK